MLTKQRDYLEEALDKERKERKHVEEEIVRLKAEYSKLKSYSEQIETQKAKEKSDLDTLLNTYSMHKGRIEELEPRLAELEAANQMLQQLVKERDGKLADASRTKEEVKRKYANMKGKLKAHVETESKLAKENDNIMQKLKTLEASSGTETQELKAMNARLNERVGELEGQTKELAAGKAKLGEKLKEAEDSAAEARTAVAAAQERTDELENEKRELQVQLQQQTETANKYQEDLVGLQKGLEGIKSEVANSGEQTKKELEASKVKVEELTSSLHQASAKAVELESVQSKSAEKVVQLEEELKDLVSKLSQSRKMNEELEERNYKLMDALHQDVANRTKQYKGRTLATLAQDKTQQAETLAVPAKENVGERSQFSFREPCPKSGKSGVSPPQNLVVESADDIAMFDSMHRPATAFSPVDGNLNGPGKVKSPAKLVPREAGVERNSGAMPPTGAEAKRIIRPAKAGIVTKLQDFEQRLRDSLSKSKK